MELGSIIFTLSHLGIYKPPDHSLLQAEQSQVSLAFLVGEMTLIISVALLWTLSTMSMLLLY